MDNMTIDELQQIVSVCLDEIIKLKDENTKLRNDLNNNSLLLTELFRNQKDLAKSNESLSNSFNLQVKHIDSHFDNLRYELNVPALKDESVFYPNFYSIEETITDIINNRKSLARFGDGEFALMSNVERQKFQRLDPKLTNRLKEVIQADEKGFLIAIADNYGDLSQYNAPGRAGIRQYMTPEVRLQHKQFIDLNRIYHNTYLSRPYALFADNHTDAPKHRFEALKQIWNERDVIMVEGSLTGLGVGNDLFDNATQIRRIEAPAESSFDKYDEILAAALQHAKRDTLFLIALGPSAGVLAYDLYKAGYQALDIGHLDLEYEWFLAGTGTRCEVKNKYNNEYPGGNQVEEIKDPTYLSQIICKI